MATSSFFQKRRLDVVDTTTGNRAHFSPVDPIAASYSVDVHSAATGFHYARLEVDGSISMSPVRIGGLAGAVSQGARSVAIGESAGTSNQHADSVAIGSSAGATTQGEFCVAIGNLAGNSAQETGAVALGREAGATTQRQSALAVGLAAGNSNQQSYALAAGVNAGRTTQGTESVSLGLNSGTTAQGAGAVAVGAETWILRQREKCTTRACSIGVQIESAGIFQTLPAFCQVMPVICQVLLLFCQVMSVICQVLSVFCQMLPVLFDAVTPIDSLFAAIDRGRAFHNFLSVIKSICTLDNDHVVLLQMWWDCLHWTMSAFATRGTLPFM